MGAARRRVLFGAVIGLVLSAGPGRGQERVYDLIFAGGRVVDGTGAPWFRADVGVIGDRIASIGDLAKAAATRRIDASRLVVAPGFIDMMGQSEYKLLVDNRVASKITQGITTEITGEGIVDRPAEPADDRGRPGCLDPIRGDRPIGRHSPATGKRSGGCGPRSTWGRSWAPAASAISSSAGTTGPPGPRSSRP